MHSSSETAPSRETRVTYPIRYFVATPSGGGFDADGCAASKLGRRIAAEDFDARRVLTDLLAAIY